MAKSKKYIVKKPCRPNGVEYMKEGEVTLTQREAKYLLMSGHIVPKDQESEATKTTTAKKAGTK